MPRISDNPIIQATYEKMVHSGVSHNLAEMFALGQPPMSNTDREFWEGRWNQFEDNTYAGDYYKSVASKAGVSTTGKFYQASLARYPGDPRAWVSDRHDVQKICEERGWGCEGSVNVPVKNIAEPKAKYEVADDIVEGHLKQAIAKNPELKHKDRGELKHEIKESISPDWS